MREEEVAVERSEGELSLSKEEEPCGRPAARETGTLAGGTRPRQPGKSNLNSFSAIRAEGVAAGGGPRSSRKLPYTPAELPAESPPATSVCDHALADMGLQGFLAGLKEMVQWFEVRTSRQATFEGGGLVGGSRVWGCIHTPYCGGGSRIGVHCGGGSGCA